MIVFSFLYGPKHLTIFQYNEFGRTMISKGKHSGGFLKNYFLEIIHKVLIYTGNIFVEYENE